MNRMTLVAIAAGFALTSTAPAQAGVTVGIHIGNHRPGYYERARYDTRRIAFDNGYRDGLREGAKDDRRNDRFEYRDERAYRNGDAGYRGYYGPRYVYVDAYRDGFAEGYRAAYAARWDRGRGDRYDRGWEDRGRRDNRRYDRR